MKKITLFCFKQISLKYTKPFNFQEKLVFDSYEFMIFPSDNPADFHEEISFLLVPEIKAYLLNVINN